MNTTNPAIDDLNDLASPATTVWTLGGLTVGAVVALLLLPTIAPGVASSIAVAQPKTWWHLSRASGLVAMGMLTASMALGLGLSTRLARTWPGAARAFVLHEHVSLVALVAAATHALFLLGDRHTPFGWLDLVLPFGASHAPIAVGLGQVALLGVGLLVGSSHLKKRLGPRAWRAIHGASFATYALGLAHGIAAGTDRTAMLVAVVAATLVAFLVAWRVLDRVTSPCPRVPR